MASSHPPSTLPPPSTLAHHHHGAPHASHTPYPQDPYGSSYQHAYPQAPLPPPQTQYGGVGSAGPQGGPRAAPTVYVQPTKIEMQPWARDVWRWLVNSTTGVARVDLRRPTPPLPEQYGGNILVVNTHAAAAAAAPVGPAAAGGRGGRGLFGKRRGGAQPLYEAAGAGQPPQVVVAGGPLMMAQRQRTGARIKITRSFLIGGAKEPDSSEEEAAEAARGKARGAATEGAEEEGGKRHGHGHAGRLPLAPPPLEPRPRLSEWAKLPLLDVGVGVNLDMDSQQIQPVARIKVKNLVSIKAAPLGLIKVSRTLPLGPVALKFRYEVPLTHLDRFWEPPARLMVRLEQAAGTGVHFTPGGIEFDERVLRFGRAVSLRASAGLAFPRQLPFDAGAEGEGSPFRLSVHRLSLKSIW